LTEKQRRNVETEVTSNKINEKKTKGRKQERREGSKELKNILLQNTRRVTSSALHTNLLAIMMLRPRQK
jgi:hypothetical protein